MNVKLFNKDYTGAQEIVRVLGVIDEDLDWSKWEPLMRFGLNQVENVVGKVVTTELDKYYRGEVPATVEDPEGVDNSAEDVDNSAETVDNSLDDALFYCQQAVAMFTWLRVIPTLDAQHGTAGRGKHLGENEHGMTAVQEFKDEENIRNMAYEALDLLVKELDTVLPQWWQDAENRKLLSSLLIRSKQEFDLFYHIGSHRLFLTLIPMIREVQHCEILPRVGKDLMDKMLKGECQDLRDACCRPLALLAVKKAVERLPVELIPEGVVQVQQSGMVKDRLKADKSSRDMVAQALAREAVCMLATIEDMVATLGTEEGGEADLHLPKPTYNDGGFSF